MFLEVKFKLSINEIVNWVTDGESVDTAAIWETPDTQPEELSEGKRMDINEESEKVVVKG